MQELPFLHSARHLMLIDICMKFREDSLRGFQVIERTRFMTDRQTDGRTDVPTFIFFLDILHVRKLSNNTTSTQQYPLLLRIKSYFQRL